MQAQGRPGSWQPALGRRGWQLEILNNRSPVPFLATIVTSLTNKKRSPARCMLRVGGTRGRGGGRLNSWTGDSTPMTEPALQALHPSDPHTWASDT